MKKAFKFMGIALLAAGVSFAVSSCEKEVATAPEQEVVVEEVVDFEEITKCDLEDIQKATDQTKKAIEAIVKGFTGLYDEAEKAQEEFTAKFESALLDMFTGAFKGEKSTTINIGSVFHTALEVVINHGSKNDIKVTCSKGILQFETKEGYYLDICIPDWEAYVGEESSSFTFTKGLKYSVEIGKGDVTYSYVLYTFGDKKTASAEISLYYEGREIGAFYHFCPYTWVMDYDSLEVWFTNIEANKDNVEAISDINVKNLDEVFWALNQITSNTYSYTGDVAEDIAAAFNDNVTNAYPEILYKVPEESLTYAEHRAQFRGKKMWAAPVYDDVTRLNKVVVYYSKTYGDPSAPIVTPEKVIKILKDKIKEIFGDGNLVGVPFEPKQD